MVIMDGYYAPPDRLYDIWQTIDKLHLGYLEMEESQGKIQQRLRLEEHIRNYLETASHYQKFNFGCTGEVLYRSARKKNDFSAYKASAGWNAIQLYAGNLLAQPWRKEYRQIKKYCGFYKHQVDANLSGADQMFEAMGYRHVGDGSILQLDGPICPDRVTSVSKDCLIAYVECQILKSIWEEIRLNGHDVSWLDLIEFRRTHLCTSAHAVKAFRHRSNDAAYYRTLPPPPPPPHVLYTYPPNGYYATYATPHAYPYPPPPPPPPASCAIYGNGCMPPPPIVDYPNAYDVVDGATMRERNDSNQSEDWDYVFRELENKGYSKDLGDRGDILNGALNELSLNNGDRKVAITPSNRSKTLQREKAPPPASMNDGLRSRTLDIRRRKPQKGREEADEENGRWKCGTCTYLNVDGVDICEMCSKSRFGIDQKMEIGGPECARCTLVNPKDALTCQACASSLKGSPTYI